MKFEQHEINDCIVLITKDDGKYHLSISNKKRLPTYNELKEARYRFLPDNVTMAQLFPPKAEFVNIHPNCLHLWEI